MIAAMPTGKAGTPDGFVKMLLEHVVDADVCALSLEGACRELEETQKFLLTISEVLAAIKEHRDLWRKRRYALRTLEQTAEEVQAHVERLRPKAELEAARQQYNKARDTLNHWLAVWKRRKEDAAARQEEARKAYQRVEEMMTEAAKCEQRVDEAMAALRQANLAFGRAGGSTRTWRQMFVSCDNCGHRGQIAPASKVGTWLCCSVCGRRRQFGMRAPHRPPPPRVMFTSSGASASTKTAPEAGPFDDPIGF